MDSLNVTGFTSMFFGRTGMRSIRRTASCRRTQVCTSIAAMPVKTYKLRPWKEDGQWSKPRIRMVHRWVRTDGKCPMSGMEMTETTRKALIMWTAVARSAVAVMSLAPTYG
jgi:hypothetical protein